MDYRTEARAARLPALNRKRVLYAEDDLLNRQLLAILLRQVGIDCELACDGKTALTLFSARSYDAVILDTYMPGLNGEDVAREIRRIDKKVPLMALTSDLEAVEKLRAAGVDRVFFKPLRGRECLEYLLERI